MQEEEKKNVNTKKIILIIIIPLLIIGGFLFYWYEYRPSQITKECANTAKEKAIKKRQVNEDTTEEKFLTNDYNTYFEWCLQEKGMTK